MAAYSAMSLHEAQTVLERYGLTITSLVPLAGGAANSSFVATTDERGDIVVTVLDNHDTESAGTLADLTDWLIARGVTTPPILRDLDDQAISQFEGKPVVMRPRIAGTQPTRLSLAESTRTGLALAHLHSLDPPTAFHLSGRRLPVDWREQIGGAAPVDLVRTLDLADRAFATARIGEVRLIHGDLFPDNMIWGEDGELYLLDWETASLDWPPLDLGFTAVGLAADDLLHPEARIGLVEGYASGGGCAVEELLPLVTLYACAVLMFHRYVRHAIRFPDPDRQHSWSSLLTLFRSMENELQS